MLKENDKNNTNRIEYSEFSKLSKFVRPAPLRCVLMVGRAG